MANDIPELKPCPFCGGEASVWTTDAYSCDSADHVIGCELCNIYTPFAGVFESNIPSNDDVKEWNARKPSRVKPLVWLERRNNALEAGPYSVHLNASPSDADAYWRVKLHGKVICKKIKGVDRAIKWANDYHEKSVLSLLE